MNIITPITITDTMIGAGTTIAEPSTTETAWAASTAYVIGDVRIRTTTHRKYKCAVAHTSAASPTPENDPTRWVDVGPTDRYAPFDFYTSTAALATTTETFVVSPGYFNAVALYGLTGAQYALTLKDAPGGATLFTRAGFLSEDPMGWYEYLFGALRPVNKLIFKDLPIRPAAELTLTITAASGQPVGLGMLVVGDYTPLYGSDWGGTQYGASAEPISYSYINTADDGTTNIVRRHSATNLRAGVVLPRAEADSVLQSIQRVLDTPVAWIASEAPGYAGLNTFGLGSASVSYDSNAHATIDINVKGMV